MVFLNETYHINSIMNTTGLDHCEIELRGTLLWSTNITYWLNNSMPVGYQNQSTAWYFGGKNIHWNGFGYGTLDGNGQVWYDFVNGVSNFPRRPHQITIWETYNSVFEGLRFVQSQMWTMTVKNSQNVLLQDIYVNSTSNSSTSTSNTDGADTIYARNITFLRWDVDNGDDGIAAKANSSEIYIYDSIFRRGQGLAIGSIGQFPGVFEFVENVYARNISFSKTRWAMYIKTWTGVEQGFPPNGGGGGLGFAKNINLHSVKTSEMRGIFQITQCTSFEGATNDCDTSQFQISELHYGDIMGTTTTNEVADLQCSKAAPCSGIEIENVTLDVLGGGVADGFVCSNVRDPEGFRCAGGS